MKPREVWLLLALAASGLALRPHSDQAQDIKYITAEEASGVDRAKRDVNVASVERDISSVFHLNDSHLHLMVHWAGQGSSIVFCLARDQEISESSTSRVFISTDYGTTFKDISGSFILQEEDREINSTTKKLATINKFFHHPSNNCYYVFTDILHKHMFVTLDCGKTVATYKTQFSPRHLEFDEKLEGRFLVHDREDEKMELFVTKNFGETFSHAGDYIKSFYFDHREDATLLYVSRMEPSGNLNILSSSSFFERQIDTRVVFTGAKQFEKKDGFLFAVTETEEGSSDRQLHVARPGERFVVAEFPEGQSLLDFHVAEVTSDDGLLVIVNHAGNLSSLYISDVVSEYEVQFSLALPRIMYYAKNTTWRSSWLEKMQENLDKVEANFADFYRVSGLRGVYLASQLAEGVTEESLRPPNLTTLISFNSGATWQPVQGPKTDHEGNPVQGCYQESDCSLHIAQQLSRKYPATRSIPVLTSKAAPGLLLASGNMGHSLGYKTSVFLSADAGLSWHQVLKGNYYYNVGDHGGVIVAVKYFKTEGDTNTLLYSIDEGLTWKSHQFYDTPIRIFGLITEPGENTTVFTMFGTQSSPSPTIDWIIVRVDLRSVFERNCTDVDYKDWSPAAPGQGKESRCVLGRKEVYKRRSPRAKCYNGLDFTHTTRVEQCPCSHLDYQCDFGFIRDKQGNRDSHCIKDPQMDDHDPFAAPVTCSPGTLFNQTKGYRRIAGDTCEAGLDTRYEPELRACPLDLAEPRTFLLVAQRKRIVRLDLSAPNSTIEALPLIGMRNVIAMDFDISTDCVFWGDIDQDKIMKQCLNDSSPPQVLAESRLSSVEGMAFDHISKILYFVDGTQKKIELLKVDRKHGSTHLRKTILHQAELGESSKPRGIAVHPSQGYLFYSDWADKGACIGRARLDGSDHKTIISTVGQNKNRRLLGWPNGLTVDVWANRIYFVDAQKDFLASANLDGGDFKKVVFGRAETAHPFAVAVFQKKGLVLWNDWTRKAIYQADKNSGKGIVMLQNNVEGAMDMKIYSPGVLAERNACSENDCSHLCMAMPPNTGAPYKCLCPDGMKVDGPEGRQCKCPNGDLPTDDTCPSTNGQCGQDQWKCGNGLCIAESWLCDGVSDCGDNTDENNEQCREKCKDNQFQCGNGKCVPGYWKCDFDDDCGDGSDEHDCPETTCSDEEFRCDNGQCINAKWECDLEKDCQDGSDESKCTSSTNVECDTGTNGTQFKCITGGACIPKAWKCDGDQDCPDDSDEDKCEEVKSCQDWQFKCDNGHCIFQTWRCDGDSDCADESDERDCLIVPGNRTDQPQPTFPRGVCNEWMFKCSNEQCVPFWWKCDGVRDCADGSDEELCGHDDVGEDKEDPQSPPGHPEVVGCPQHKFQCNDGSCIWAAWVCDTEADCSHGEDEEPSLCSARQACGAGKFMCELSGTCIDIEAVCDGKRDCDDGTDEKRCSIDPFVPSPEVACDVETSFLCDLGETCVSWAGKCDGHHDCVDGSDEQMCDLWIDERKVEGLEVEEDRSTSTSLTVLWWVPDIPSTKELRFKYGFSIGDHGQWKNVSDWEHNENLEYTFTDLQPGTEYDLRVFVKNATDGQEFLHAPVAEGRTRDGVPDSPRQLAMVQKGSSMELSWEPPLDPRGSITNFIVRVLKGGDRVKEVEVGADTTSLSLPWLEQDTVYQAEVMAENQEHRSTPSSRIEMIKRAGQSHVSAIEVTNTTATLTWEVDIESEGSFFNVTYSSSNPLANLAPGGSKKVKGSTLTLHGLSPGEKYTVLVSKVQGSGHTAPSSTSFNTLGPRLPIPELITADAISPTQVKMSWTVEEEKQVYSYGVWWGVNMEELMTSGPKMRTEEKHATAEKLLPCTKYLFAVAVLGLGKAGSGPIGRMSVPKIVSTRPSLLAPPRDLRADGFVLTWKQPCDSALAAKPLPSLVYQITLKDELTGKIITKTLEPSDKPTNTFAFHELQAGSRWEAMVKINKESAIPSPPVTLMGPLLPPPTAVYAHSTEEGYSVSWAPSSQAKSYEVVLSPDPNFENKTCEVRLPAREGPLNLRPNNLFNSSLPDACRHKAFSVGVVAIADGGVSAYSRAGQTILPVSLLPPPGTITIEESSAVGTVVGVLIVLCLLGAGLGYFAYSNRRMRTRFREFTAGHYSSATGTATLIDDDDESPIIRGFSDDEPLVM